MDYAKKAMEMHEQLKGKLEVVSKVKIETRDDLSTAYTPGVAAPCLEIQKNPNKSYELTGRGNCVAVITDGSAVLGLGDIGPEAGMPVMEGKCVLFKEFGGVDAIPLCIRSKDVGEIVRTISLLAGSFGGINLEDIAAPRCFEIEKKLKEVCDIPVFHDDQHDHHDRQQRIQRDVNGRLARRHNDAYDIHLLFLPLAELFVRVIIIPWGRK